MVRPSVDLLQRHALASLVSLSLLLCAEQGGQTCPAHQRAAPSREGPGNSSPTGALGLTLSTSVNISETLNEALLAHRDTVVRTPATPEPDVAAPGASKMGTSQKSQWSRSIPAGCSPPCSAKTGRGSCSRC